MSNQVFLKLKEELKLLELLIVDDICINIIGVLSGPLKEGLILISY